MSSKVFPFPITHQELIACKGVFKVKRNGWVCAEKWLRKQYKELNFTQQDITGTITLMSAFAKMWSIKLPKHMKPVGDMKDDNT